VIPYNRPHDAIERAGLRDYLPREQPWPRRRGRRWQWLFVEWLCYFVTLLALASVWGLL
jgi:hypothetical protein